VRQRQDIAAFIHLCDAEPATTFAGQRFEMAAGERCGGHLVALYVSRVNTMKPLSCVLRPMAELEPVDERSGRPGWIAVRCRATWRQFLVKFSSGMPRRLPGLRGY
jgi:hypothetical protein